MKSLNIISILAICTVFSSCSKEPADGVNNTGGGIDAQPNFGIDDIRWPSLSIVSNALDTVTAVDSLWIKTDSIVWINTGGNNVLSIAIKGFTNAKSIGVESNNDGLIGTFRLALDSGNSFNDTVAIAFSQVHNPYMTNSSKIKLYSVNGDSTEIAIVNPKQ